mmetsp:Transcript_67245/g.170529  ORF Transcript_67245/g.170529 Transcript_67245/m.170529 type:complete len:298 (-) Transcript_67245:32-925(-)
MPSTFEELCEQRQVNSDEWRKSLSTPILPEKCLLDMTDRELEAHYSRVEDRADSTKEDRALIILERAQEGRLERQAGKLFLQSAKDDKICADQVPEMLEALRFELSNTEVHFLLRKFNATEDFDMVPETELSRRQWMWLVGECQMLKDSYRHINPEAFEIAYEAMISRQKADRDPPPAGAADWPNLHKGRAGPALRPQSWGLPPEVELEMLRQVAATATNAAMAAGASPHSASALQRVAVAASATNAAVAAGASPHSASALQGLAVAATASHGAAAARASPPTAPAQDAVRGTPGDS